MAILIMTTTWTNQNKPTSSWTDVNKASGTSWNIVANGTASWTNVPNAPTNTSTTTTIVGSPIGLLLALTYATTSSVLSQLWTDVNKASGTAWTDIPKAT